MMAGTGHFFTEISRAKLKPQVVKVLPGARATLRQAITVNNNEQTQTIATGEKVLVQCIAPNEYVITPFKSELNKRSLLKEGQRDIAADSSRQGSISIEGSLAPYFSFEEQYQLSNEPLFPTQASPSLADIKQGYIPDCFLLSSIQAILNHPEGKAFIENMMRRVSDDVVEVRLFNPTDLKPIYIQVPAATIQTKAGDLSLHPALWVHALELAYASLGINGVDKRSVDASVSSVFNKGGSPAVAMSILTGIKAESKTVSHTSYSPWDIPHFWGKIWQDTWSGLDELSKVLDEESFKPLKYNSILMQVVSFESNLNVFNDKDSDEVQTKTIERKGYSAEKANCIRQYVNYVLFYREHEAGCQAIMDNKDLTYPEKLYELAGLASAKGNQAVGDYLLAYAKHELVPNEQGHIQAPVEIFTSVNNANAMAVYERLNRSLLKGELVAIATHDKPEKSIKGIAQSHAYTVLGVDMRVPVVPVKNLDGNVMNVATPHVILRNPWGNTGRVYQVKDNDIVGVEDKSADVSVLDLNDFMTICSTIYTSASQNAPFHYEAEKQRVRDNLSRHSLKSAFNAKTPLSELVLFNQQFYEVIRPVIDLEKYHLAGISPTLVAEIEAIFENAQDDEQAIIEKKLENITFPMLPLKEGRQAEYIYYLLKHRWLNKQTAPDMIMDQDLSLKIFQLCPLDFLADVKRHKINHDVFIGPAVHRYELHALHLKKIIEKINIDMDEEKTIETFNNFSKYTLNCDELNRVKKLLVALHVELKCYGYTMTDDELRALENDADALINFFTGIAKQKDRCEEIKAEIVDMLHNAYIGDLLTRAECEQYASFCKPDVIERSDVNFPPIDEHDIPKANLLLQIREKIMALITLTRDMLKSIFNFKKARKHQQDTMFDESLLITPAKEPRKSF